MQHCIDAQMTYYEQFFRDVEGRKGASTVRQTRKMLRCNFAGDGTGVV